MKSSKYLCVLLSVILCGCGGYECLKPAKVKSFGVYTYTNTEEIRVETGLTKGLTSTAFAIVPSSDESSMEYLVKNSTLNLSFFQNAYATTPCGLPGFEGKIVSVDVRALNAFDQMHPAGSLVNDLIMVYSNVGSKYQKLATVLPVSMEYPRYYSPSLEFHFIKYPSDSNLQQFAAEIKLDNGVIYNVKTSDIDFSRLNNRGIYSDSNSL